MFLLLIRIRLLSGRNAVRDGVRRRPAITIALGIVGLCMFSGLFMAFWFLFSVAVQLQVFAETVNQVFFFLFLFLLSGAVPFVASTLLHAADYSLLFSAPLAPRAVTASKLLDATVTNSVQFAVLGSPAIFAACAAAGIPWWGWAGVPFLVTLFALLPALTIALALLLILSAVGVKRLRSAISVLNALSGAVVCLTLIAEFGRQGFGSGGLREILTARVQSLGQVSPIAHSTPSTWFSAIVIALGAHDYGSVLLSAARILAVLALLFTLCLALGGRLLTAANVAEDDEESSVHSSIPARDRSFWRWLLTPRIAAFIAKDMKYLQRDSVLVSQMGMPLILFVVPFVLAYQSSELRDLAFPLAAGMIAIILFMQTSILSLSSIGLEGRSFWIALAAPMSGSSLLWSKFGLCTFISAGTGIALLLGGAIAFHPPLYATGLLATAILLTSAGLCGLNIGISAAFPRFVYDNPAHRVSPWALILGFAASVGYLLATGGIATAVMLVLMQPNLPGTFPAMLYSIGAMLMLLITAGAILIPMHFGAERIEQYPWEH